MSNENNTSTPGSSAGRPNAIAKAADTARKVQDQSKRAFDKSVDMASRMSSRSLAWWGIAMAGVLAKRVVAAARQRAGENA